jgi:hypothetical protein
MLLSTEFFYERHKFSWQALFTQSLEAPCRCGVISKVTQGNLHLFE